MVFYRDFHDVDEDVGGWVVGWELSCLEFTDGLVGRVDCEITKGLFGIVSVLIDSHGLHIECSLCPSFYLKEMRNEKAYPISCNEPKLPIWRQWSRSRIVFGGWRYDGHFRGDKDEATVSVGL